MPHPDFADSFDDLVCPRDHLPLHRAGGGLACRQGHAYPVVDGIPVLLLRDAEQTHGYALESLAAADGAGADRGEAAGGGVDPFVQQEIVKTNGLMYRSLLGSLKEYPIPRLDAPPGDGASFLDLGCNWGRWCVAAARLGYLPTGIDPSLEAVRAARRVARALGVRARFIVADARFLPFAGGSFDFVYSYSVLQHFSKENATTAIGEAGRVLKPGGRAMIEMPNVFGLRCLYHQARRGFREPRNFEVRYWTPRELRSTFARLVGAPKLSVDGFFSLNPQPADADLLPLRYRAVIRTSELLRRLSTVVRPLVGVADSLYVTARKPSA
ncbi:MAG TPA: methyltransferase domain-containing protein [Longimicrobiaceae bacterium]